MRWDGTLNEEEKRKTKELIHDWETYTTEVYHKGKKSKWLCIKRVGINAD